MSDKIKYVAGTGKENTSLLVGLSWLALFVVVIALAIVVYNKSHTSGGDKSPAEQVNRQ